MAKAKAVEVEAAAAARTKRKWADVDWDVVLAAQTYVAVYAAPGEEEKEEEEEKKKKHSAKGKKESKKKATPPTKNKVKGKTKGKAATRASTRRGRKKSKVEQENEEEETNEDQAEEMTDITTSAAATPVEYWLAELQDDVTEDMLAGDACVRVTWLDVRQPGPPPRYEMAYDDVVDVASILCHVYLREFADDSLELTPKSLARVERNLTRTKRRLAGDSVEGDEDEDMSDGEKPPPSSRKKRPVSGGGDGDDERPSRRRSGGGGGGGGAGGGRSGGGRSAKKLSKREEAMHIPPHYASLDLAKYEDSEIRGTHPFKPIKDDVLATSKEVIRAVVTKNHKLLKKLTQDKTVYKTIHSFSVTQSVDVEKTALQYAMDADDLTAAGLILKAREIKSHELASTPDSSLPTHSTGRHTSAYSDYNRRAINASRGGREGNNALAEDANGSVASGEESYFWKCKNASVKMLMLLYSTGDWMNGYAAPYNVGKACRHGNYILARKLIETLGRNGGWGFNDLHSKVLSDTDESLPVFRSVSAIKQAHQTKIRPLHLAAINPNTKYLEALWDSAGDEWSGAKDDLLYEPIHYAAVCESTGPLAFLLERKCSLFARTKRRETPVMRAICAQREENAIFMFEKAAEDGDDVCTKVMGERGPKSFQAIHYAAIYGCGKVLEYIVTHNADINSVSEGKLSALCLASRAGHYDCVEILLKHGAKIDLGDKLKKTPLMFAIKNGHTRIAALLINHGANVNAYDTSENSVAHYAASYGWESCLVLLADAGAEFWAKNSWGFVPLTCALLKQRTQCSEFILERDPNREYLDFRDRQGCTMLYLQCRHSKSLSQIKYLLEKGMNPNICDSENKYPLQVLIDRAQRETSLENPNTFFVDAIRLLLENKAVVQYTLETPAKSTTAILQPLQMTITHGLQDVFLILLRDFDADPSACASDGSDAWMTAALHGRKSEFFLETLLKHHRHKSGNKKLDLEACDTDGDNFFHAVAANDLMDIISPVLIRECVELCEKATELLHAKNVDGFTPLQRLLSRERSIPSEDLASSEHTEKLEAIKQADARYSDLVDLFAQHTTASDSWVRYVDINKPLGWRGATTESPIESRSANLFSVGTSTSRRRLISPQDKLAMGIPASSDIDENRSVIPTETQPPKMVKFASLLHYATNRNLTLSSENLQQKWFGRNLVDILVKWINFDEETVNFPEYDTSKTPLDHAVRIGDSSMVGVLLSLGAKANCSPIRCDACEKKNSRCSETCSLELYGTPLMVATLHSYGAIVELLLDHGANVNCYDNRAQKNSPLHVALAADHVQITTLLLERGADLLKVNANGSTPLHHAIISGRSVVVKKPHDGEVKYTHTETSLVATPAQVSAISIALINKQGAEAVIMANTKEQTPVHLAALNRDLELLRACVNASMNKSDSVNVRDQFGRTPLHYAVNAASMRPDASFEVERFLLRCGADANASDDFGFSVLHFALLKVRLSWHANYDKNKDENESAREQKEGIYESKKRAAFLEVLSIIPGTATDPVETVSNLASIPNIKTTTQDILGRTALHLAAATGAFVCASALLAVQTTVAGKKQACAVMDNNDFTPLGRAVQHLRQTTIMTLLQNGADVDGDITIKESQGDVSKCTKRSYFYHAVQNSLPGICHMLLNAKFDKRQAVEDAILCGQFQLASNLMVGIEVSNGNDLLKQKNAHEHNLLHSLATVDQPFDDLAQNIAWALIDAGINPGDKDSIGNSPLHYAAHTGNIHLMDFLLHNHNLRASNKLYNQVNNLGETPLLSALKRSSIEVNKMIDLLKYLLTKESIDVRTTDKTGNNVLTAFLDRYVDDKNIKQTTCYEWTEKLLKMGVTPNSSFSTGSSTDFFKNEKFGSSVDTKVQCIIRVLASTSSQFRCEMLALLIRFGAKIDATDGNGNSLLMHLVANNKMTEVMLVLGRTKTVRDPTDPKEARVHSVHIPSEDIKHALMQKNSSGQTALHLAVQPLPYGSFENTALIDLLVASGADLRAKDNNNHSAVDYASEQASHFVYRFLRSKYSDTVSMDEHEAFDEPMDNWEPSPDFSIDSAAYIESCKTSGKICRKEVKPQVNSNCDVGNLKRVFGKLDEEGNVISGEEYTALLTKVDVKNGMHGLNVFYRCQIVHDQIQDIYIVFTNWGRIGESGKFQNTPFHAADDAVVEFKKIFRSKTGNQWQDRRAFIKRDKKYNLVQRNNYETTLSDEVTSSFVEDATVSNTVFAPSKKGFTASISEMLFAITDIRNLQLAATENCNYHSLLPLANSDELRIAIDKLFLIRGVIDSRSDVEVELGKVRGDISDEASSKLAELSQRYTELTEEISEMSSRYYEIMPCDEDSFGSSIQGFDDIDSVNAEITRIRLLVDVSQTYKMLLGAKYRQQTIHPLDYCHDAMQIQVAEVPKNSGEEKLLTKFFFSGIRPHERSNFRISNVFNVSRNGERSRLLEMVGNKPTLQGKHGQLLWHGTKRTNLMGILSQGLRIAPPEAPHHGYMYGKGLYFANVAAKSLGYCDSPYKITTKTKNKDGEEVAKKRHVTYLLLCEVAAGTPTNVSGGNLPDDFDKQREVIDSVYAIGKYTPDPSASIVSPLSGAAVHVGNVGEMGVDFPLSSVWATTEYSPQPSYFYRRGLYVTPELTKLLDKFVQDLTEGQSLIIESNEEKSLLHRSYYSKTITVTLVSKRVQETASSEFHCDATIKVVAEEPGNDPMTFQAKRYANAFYSSEIDKGFTMDRPHTNNYDEVIVYNEGQARIRYLVEVERV